MSDTIRAFIAFALPEHILAYLRSIQKQLAPYGFHIRWVRPENIHLTLKFLGDIDNTAIENIVTAFSAAVKDQEKISFSVKGLGVFPSIKRPRVLWSGLTGDVDRVIGFQQRLDEHLSSVGFAKEERPFRAHLTLGRFNGKVNVQTLLEAIKTFAVYQSEPVTINRVILYKSDLRPSGAVYTEQESMPFG